MKNSEDISISVSYVLYKKKCFGTRQILIDELVNRFPNRIQKHIKQAINEMIRKGYLVQRPTKSGKTVYINPSYRREIQKIIEEKLTKKHPFL